MFRLYFCTKEFRDIHRSIAPQPVRHLYGWKEDCSFDPTVGVLVNHSFAPNEQPEFRNLLLASPRENHSSCSTSVRDPASQAQLPTRTLDLPYVPHRNFSTKPKFQLLPLILQYIDHVRESRNPEETLAYLFYEIATYLIFVSFKRLRRWDVSA